jgi:hypothetical protein
MAHLFEWIGFAWLRIMPDSLRAPKWCVGMGRTQACRDHPTAVSHDEGINLHNVENKNAAMQEYFSLRETKSHIEKYHVKCIEFKR